MWRLSQPRSSSPQHQKDLACAYAYYSNIQLHSSRHRSACMMEKRYWGSFHER